MATAWAYQPDMHPWFRQPSLKRSRLGSDSDDDNDLTYSVPAAAAKPTKPLPRAGERVKRRRCDALEHGLSQLTLNNTSHTPPPAAPVVTYPDTFNGASSSQTAPLTSAPGLTIMDIPPPYASAPAGWGHPQSSFSQGSAYTDRSSPVILPGSVEEPTSPRFMPGNGADIPEVNMRGPSWYEIEKDRIVITDLEDSDAETEDGAEVIVSPALLERFKRQVNDPLPLWKEPDASKALVLFRPVVKPGSSTPEGQPAPPAGSPEAAFEEVEVTPGAHLEEVQDDGGIDIDVDDVAEDAMDVEPMDVEL